MNLPKVAQAAPIIQEVKAGTYWWCTCGESKQQPFCDGTHKGKGFTPQKVAITEAKMVAWCGCKRTGKAPFCDGAHSKL
jgi:CDGSH-type Zn-finger protein